MTKDVCRLESSTPVKVTVVHPGYILTPLMENDPYLKYPVDTVTGARAIVAAIEREPARAYVPTRPWALLSVPMRLLPLH